MTKEAIRKMINNPTRDPFLRIYWHSIKDIEDELKSSSDNNNNNNNSSQSSQDEYAYTHDTSNSIMKKLYILPAPFCTTFTPKMLFYHWAINPR